MLIPDGYAQANLRFTGGSAPSGAQIVLGVDVRGTTDSPSEVAQTLYEAYAIGPLTVSVNTLILAAVDVKFGPTLTGPSGTFTGATTGTLAVTGIQPGTALLVDKNTAAGGRSGRGRVFMPGVTEADVDASGNVGAAYRSAAQAQWFEFGTGMTAAGIPLVVLHSAGAPITTPTPITSFSVQARVATQRKRLRR